MAFNAKSNKMFNLRAKKNLRGAGWGVRREVMQARYILFLIFRAGTGCAT